MQTASLERYPELLFLLHYTPFTPCRLEKSSDGFANAISEREGPLHADSISSEIERFLNKWNLNSIDVFYLYGVGMGHHYTALKEWLHQRRERRLIFLEDSLEALAAAVESEEGGSLFSDPQVVIKFNQDPRQWDAQIEELVFSQPSERVEIGAIESYLKRKKKSFHALRLKVLRFSAVAHALMTEALYAHKLLPNLLRNIQRWPRSFLAGNLKNQFQGVPAIICGAGPSLSENIPLLKELEDRALIIAGGSTIAALSNQGVVPHIGLALDPNGEEFGRLKIASAYEMPLVYATRLQPDVFNALNGEIGYLVSDTGGACEHYFEQEMEIDGEPVGPELGVEAFSVTTLAIALAVEMGCNPILLNGIDLAYTGMRRYAEGILPCSAVKVEEMEKETKAPERMLKRKDIHGHYVHTLVKWVMESDCIASYAKAHPESRFYNISAQGIGFSQIPNTSLSALIDKELGSSWDLRAQVHAQIAQLRIPISSEKLCRKMEDVGESLLRLGSFAEEMIEEYERIKERESLPPLPTGKIAILEMDFQEEIAFKALFPLLGPALDRLLDRAFYTCANATEEEKRGVQVNKQIAKWKQWKEMIESEIAVFQTVMKG